jgi:SAM-dependent methyltransferase
MRAMPRQRILYCPRCKKTLQKAGDRYFCRSCARSYPVVDGVPSFVDPKMIVDSFDASAFEFLFEMEQRHFYHIGRREIILDVLRRNIPNLARLRMLEIGCGNGCVLAYLKQNSIDIEGGDILVEGLRFCQRRLDSAVLYQIDILALPFRSDFDIIGAFDVLEHIDNDGQALSEISQALKPGGRLILTVPAHKFLWSRYDESANHKRRYSREELVAKLEENGFTIKKVSFFMSSLLPLLALIRLVGNMFRRKKGGKRDIKAFFEVRTIPVVNEVFLGLLRLEKWLIRRLDLPFGSALLVLAEKRR